MSPISPASKDNRCIHKLPLQNNSKHKCTKGADGPSMAPVNPAVVGSSKRKLIILDDENDVEYVGSNQRERSPGAEAALEKERAFIDRVARAISEKKSIATIGDILSARKTIHNFPRAEQQFVTFVDADNNILGLIHKGIVCQYSEHLSKLINDHSQDENTTSQFTVEGTDAEVFSHFYNWIYDSCKVLDAPNLDTVQFAKLWVFAEKHKIPILAQDVLVYLFRFISLEVEAPIAGHDTQLVEFLKLAYSLGPSTSLAKLAVDRMIKLAASGKDIKLWYLKYPKEMKNCLSTNFSRRCRRWWRQMEGYGHLTCETIYLLEMKVADNIDGSVFSIFLVFLAGWSCVVFRQFDLAFIGGARSWRTLCSKNLERIRKSFQIFDFTKLGWLSEILARLPF